jgi:hypothetical protein
MGRKPKAIYLVNPFTGLVEESTYPKICGILGRSRRGMDYSTANKIWTKDLNAYLYDYKPDANEIKEVMKNHIIDDEVFLRVKDSTYYVSQYGRFKRINKKKEFFVMYYIKKNGSAIVKMNLDGEYKQYTASRFVAELFVINSNPVENTSVIHLDRNRRNNMSTNLKWVTAKEASRIGGKENMAQAIPVLKICPETLEVLDDYTSCAEAGRFNYTAKSNIRFCIHGKQKTAVGFIWKIDEDFDRRKNR